MSECYCAEISGECFVCVDRKIIEKLEAEVIDWQKLSAGETERAEKAEAELADYKGMLADAEESYAKVSRKLNKAEEEHWKGLAEHYKGCLALAEEEREEAEIAVNDLDNEYEKLKSINDDLMDDNEDYHKRNAQLLKLAYTDKGFKWKDCLAQCENELAEVREENQRLREEKLEIVRGNFGQICSYCGDNAERTWDELQQHIRECPNHPLAKAEADKKEIRDACTQKQEIINGLKEDLEEANIDYTRARYDAMEAAREARRLEAEAKRYREALELLWLAKQEKENYGKSPVYESLKRAAWFKCEQALGESND